MHKRITCLLFVIQGVYMFLKGDYISYILTSRQVDTEIRFPAVFRWGSRVFGEWSSCSNLPWLVPCQQRAGSPCLCQCHVPVYRREKLGVTTVRAQCSLRKKSCSCWRYLWQLRWGSFLHLLTNDWFLERREKYWQSHNNFCCVLNCSFIGNNFRLDSEL